MPHTLNVFQLLLGAALLTGLGCDVFLLSRLNGAMQLRVGPRPWGMRELAVGTAVVFSVFLLSQLFYSLVAAATGQNLEALAPAIVPAEMGVRVMVLAGFAIAFQRKRIALLPALGIESTQARRALGWGVVFGLASLPPVGAILLASEFLCRAVGLQPSEQPITELFVTTDSRFLVAALTVFALVIAPVFEEFFFRGFAYPALKQRLGTSRALVIVSAVFAVTHMHAPSLFPLFALAIGLGLAYELTGSLLTPITMHAVFNGLMIVRLFFERAHT